MHTALEHARVTLYKRVFLCQAKLRTRQRLDAFLLPFIHKGYGPSAFCSDL
ncbi:MAG: hypothetical protein JSC085_000697 [Candidatus Tokpelaia sp. JSC085]|nr:MAG: hypothetical protein JSC085_000697 [Candidatus Tokpelaia sp. JSC085]